MFLAINALDTTERVRFDDEKSAQEHTKSRTNWFVVSDDSTEGYILLKSNEVRTAKNRQRLRDERRQDNQGVKKSYQLD